MFELFAVGLEMQKRMIDAQMQGVEVARDMVEAARDMVEVAQGQVEGSLGANQVNEAGAKAMKSWMNLWGWRA